MAEQGSPHPHAAPPPQGYPQQPMYAPQPRGGGCLPWLVLLLLLALGASVLFNLALIGARVAAPPDRVTELREEVVEGEGPHKVALIEVEGVIIEEGRGEGGLFAVPRRVVTEVRRRLEIAAADPEVRAVVVRVESPGGTVSHSDQIWRALRDFRAETDKPLVVSMGAVATSGGYYIAAPADLIMAEPTTITGSIGVLASTLNLAGLLERLDIAPVTIRSGDNKDLLNPLEPVREEHLRILQGVVESAHTRFVDVVAQGRPDLDEEAVRALADGSIYTAEQALELQLIDRVGYEDEAYAAARELAGIEEALVVRYGRPVGLWDVLSGRVESRGVVIDLSQSAILQAETPRLLYLWRP